MKNLFIAILFSFYCLCATAQAVMQGRQITRALDTNAVAYDEQGKVLKYYQYTKLLNSGEYTIRPNGIPGAPGTTMTIVKMDEDQKATMYSNIRRNLAIKSGVLKEGNVLDAAILNDAVEQENFEGKAIAMIFWNAGCPPCTASFENINDILKELNDARLVSVAVTNDSKNVAAAMLKQKPLLATHLISNGYKVSGAYGVYEYPTYVVTDKNHVIKFAMTGSSPLTLSIMKGAMKTALER